MPLTKKGEKIIGSMEKEYGPEKAKKVFYASKNRGVIKGVEGKKKHVAKKMGMKEAKKHFESLERLDYRQPGSHEEHELPKNKILHKKHRRTMEDYY